MGKRPFSKSAESLDEEETKEEFREGKGVADWLNEKNVLFYLSQEERRSCP